MTRAPLLLTPLLAALCACGVAPADDVTGEQAGVGAGNPTLSARIHPQPIALRIHPETARAAGAVLRVQDLPADLRPLAEGTMRIESVTQTNAGAPIPLFLNRRGGTYTSGADDSLHNVSSVVQSGSATLPPFAGNDAQWNTMKACVTDQFSRFNMRVTDVEPVSGAYIEAVVGGAPQLVALPSGVGGVAPIDYSDHLIPRAVVYIFSGVLGDGNDPQLLCEVAAQEIAHAFSLDHEFLCQDPMTYLSGCGNKTFHDQDAQCGEFQPRQCGDGAARQNSVQKLILMAGAAGTVVTPPPTDNTPPTVSVQSPADQASLPANSTIQVVATANDDVGLASVNLNWAFTGDTFPCPFSGGGGAVVCTVSGTTYTWAIKVGAGTRPFTISATDVGGHTVTTTSRTINLTDGSGTVPTPPVDSTPPVITLASPSDNATLPANTVIQIVANASDNTELGSVDLLWTFTGDTFTCPFAGQAVTCTQSGSTYTWNLNVGVGARAFQVRAIDTAGNQTVSPLTHITLAVGNTDPVNPGTGDSDSAEPNDTAAQAFSTRCGSAIDLVAVPGNEDWFTTDAPQGTPVQIAVSAPAGTPLAVDVRDAQGNSVIAHASDAVTAGDINVTSPGPSLTTKVTTTAATAQPYRLTVTCGQPPSTQPANDDAAEPNNTLAAAKRLTCGSNNTNLISLDDDYYVVSVNDRDTLHVDVTGEPTVVADLETNSGRVLAAASNAPSQTNLLKGDVFIHVPPATHAGAAYELTLTCASAGLPNVTTGCSSSSTDSGAPTSALLLAGLGALFVRRRRMA
jgi:MYXO-CTERM domain-containing protein